MTENHNDTLYRFLFDSFGVRGGFVRLGASWRAIREKHDYPAPVARALGEAMAAAALLSTTIKFRGSLVMQLLGEGVIRSLVAQVTDRRTLRGVARFDEDAGDGQPLFAQARLVLTAESLGGERYQGIVPVEAGGVAEALARYFEQSEQLPTRLWLAANEDVAAGLFLQRMPADDEDSENWQRVVALTDTLNDGELLTLDAETVLHRLFHEETLRLFEPEPVSFRCDCSRERVGEMLKTLGEGELAQVLDEMGEVEVACEFCGQTYRFDSVDVAGLFQAAPADAPEGLH